jgi:tetratricopeptide (TPR) repeat protein
MGDEDTLAPGATGTDFEPAHRIGRYVVIDKIGQGGMGVVYSAYDDALDRAVAIKLIHPQRGGAEDQERLVREARTLARLQHPNVVAVHDAQTVGELVYVAMELVQGSDLRAWRAARPRSVAENLEVFIQAGRGLAAAHAAGIVHRDFKPANVLVGADGRVRVADFGLAVGVTGDTAPPSVHGSGTPAYMAPEQHRGEPTTPLSDQFSFCVSLFEALCDKTPYPVDALRDGTARAPELGKLPAWLRAPLARGLALAPADRFPSMDGLLRALARDPATRRRRWLAIGAAAVVTAGAVGGAVAMRRASVAPGCAGGELVGIWDGAQRERMRAAFAATGLPVAEVSWLGAVASLDRYASRLAAARAGACAAGARPDERRMACLDQRRQLLAATVSVLVAADADIVDKAVQAAQALPQIDACADVASLLAQAPPPDDPAMREQVRGLRERLAKAKALADAEKYPPALALVADVDKDARSLAYSPVVAEAALLRGFILTITGEAEHGEDAYYEAIFAGDLGQHREVVATAWIDLIWAVGGMRRQPDAISRISRFADVALQKLGDPPELRGRYWGALAGVAAHQRHFDEMEQLDRRALAFYERALGPDNPASLEIRSNLARIAEGHGRFAEALAAYQELLPAFAAANGPEHPDTIRMEMALGSALDDLGRGEEAVAVYRHALAVREKVLGREHADVGTAASRLAAALTRLGRHDEALALDERALAIKEKAYGPDHPSVAISVAQMGDEHVAHGDLAGARRFLERALEIREKRVATAPGDVANSLERLARLEIREGRLADAEAHAVRAVGLREGGDPIPLLLGASYRQLGEVYLAGGQLARAREAFDKALATFARGETPAAMIAETKALRDRAAGP